MGRQWSLSSLSSPPTSFSSQGRWVEWVGEDGAGLPPWQPSCPHLPLPASQHLQLTIPHSLLPHTPFYLHTKRNKNIILFPACACLLSLPTSLLCLLLLLLHALISSLCSFLYLLFYASCYSIYPFSGQSDLVSSAFCFVGGGRHHMNILTVTFPPPWVSCLMSHQISLSALWK